MPFALWYYKLIALTSQIKEFSLKKTIKFGCVAIIVICKTSLKRSF